MSERLLVASRALRKALASFEPAASSGDDCARLAEDLALTEKACAAAKARAATRAAEVGAHLRRGHRDAVDWLARSAGSTAGEARAVLATTAALGECPETNEAVVAGELSLAQAGEITRTEAACPGSEAELVGLARTTSLGVLRERARSRRHRGLDPEELLARQRQARGVRHWRDDLGLVRLDLGLLPEVGVPFVNRLEAETDRIRKLARRAGSDEPRAAHMADALVQLLNGKGTASTTRAELTVVWNRSADDRCEEGEAHLIGGGPVPLSVARRLAERAAVKAVVHDGVRIESVRHFGRYIPAELRTALALGGPPGFDGVVCTDCGTRHGIQYDHVDPVANGGATTQRNLTGRCWDCHEKKTERDRQAGLLRGNGNRPKREPP